MEFVLTSRSTTQIILHCPHNLNHGPSTHTADIQLNVMLVWYKSPDCTITGSKVTYDK